MRRKLLWLAALNTVLLVALAFSLGSYRALRSRFSAEEGRVSSLESKVRGLQDKISGYEKLRKDLELFKRKRLFSRSRGLVEVRNFIISAHRKAGLVFSGLFFETPEKVVGKIYSVKVSFEVMGSYQALRRLIYLLENSDRLLILRNFSLRRTDPYRAKVKFIMEAYLHGE